MSQVLLLGLWGKDHDCVLDRGGRLQTYNPVLERHELLFLLFPALKVGFNEGLQFIQVLLHALAVDVLHQTEIAAVATLPQVKPPGAAELLGEWGGGT